MYASGLFHFVAVCLVAARTRAEPRVAIARLVSPPIDGTVTFTEVSNGILVDGYITGMADGQYGFHIHELGDISTCYTTGAHFDVDGNNHGGRDHAERHVGDFGNVVFVGNDTHGVANFSFVDAEISFTGRRNIVGRALVLHEQTDDLGLGGHEMSLVTGNAGGRVACGVIGIKSPADGDVWANSGFSATVSTTLLLAATLVSYLRLI